MNERSYTSIPPVCLHGMHRDFTLTGSTGSTTVWEEGRCYGYVATITT